MFKNIGTVKFYVIFTFLVTSFIFSYPAGWCFFPFENSGMMGPIKPTMEKPKQIVKPASYNKPQHSSGTNQKQEKQVKTPWAKDLLYKSSTGSSADHKEILSPLTPLENIYFSNVERNIKSIDNDEEIVKDSLDREKVFEKSSWYEFLRGNNFKNIQVYYSNVDSDEREEVVVASQKKLEVNGFYYSLVDVFESDADHYFRIWNSSKIPGEILNVTLQDIDNDHRNEIIIITKTGKQESLKTLRIYKFDDENLLYEPVLSMDSIYGGTVYIEDNIVFVLEELQDKVDRTLMYLWESGRFNRVEL